MLSFCHNSRCDRRTDGHLRDRKDRPAYCSVVKRQYFTFIRKRRQLVTLAHAKVAFVDTRNEKEYCQISHNFWLSFYCIHMHVFVFKSWELNLILIFSVWTKCSLVNDFSNSWLFVSFTTQSIDRSNDWLNLIDWMIINRRLFGLLVDCLVDGWMNWFVRQLSVHHVLVCQQMERSMIAPVMRLMIVTVHTLPVVSRSFVEPIVVESSRLFRLLWRH